MGRTPDISPFFLLQEATAVQRRMDASVISWQHRNGDAAQAVNRTEAEAYLWRPFKDVQVCAGCFDGKCVENK